MKKSPFLSVKRGLVRISDIRAGYQIQPEYKYQARFLGFRVLR
jgi:hypothetical protein